MLWWVCYGLSILVFFYLARCQFKVLKKLKKKVLNTVYNDDCGETYTCNVLSVVLFFLATFSKQSFGILAGIDFVLFGCYIWMIWNIEADLTTEYLN